MQSTPSIENNLNNKNRWKTDQSNSPSKSLKPYPIHSPKPIATTKNSFFQTLRFETLINLDPGAACAITYTNA
jgi:hypothetical protein